MILDLKTSIIDYLDLINEGVPIHICMNIYSYSFHAIYWIHREQNSLLECEPNFLKLFSVNSTYDIPFINELIEDIETILPDREEIFSLLTN